LQVLAPPALTFIAATAEAGAARRPAGRSWQRSRGDAAAAALAPAWAAGAAGARFRGLVQAARRPTSRRRDSAPAECAL